jgi:CheY-like chemotaxis protein
MGRLITYIRPMHLILVVDDDNILRSSVSAILKHNGYRVAEAVDGDHALKVLASLTPSNIPDLIILDLDMPIMNGAEFLFGIKTGTEKERSNSKIPVLIWSAAPSIKPNILKLAQGRLPKPIDLDELLTAIEETIAKAGASLEVV